MKNTHCSSGISAKYRSLHPALIRRLRMGAKFLRRRKTTNQQTKPLHQVTLIIGITKPDSIGIWHFRLAFGVPLVNSYFTFLIKQCTCINQAGYKPEPVLLIWLSVWSDLDMITTFAQYKYTQANYSKLQYKYTNFPLYQNVA